VIDEVHMLSVSAFNALLKTLEEPPEHAIFMLATTDPQKLLGTVISRTQRYDFKNVPVETLSAHVQKIAQAEGIKFSSPKVSIRLAELGKGSVRDTLSIFDQVLGLSGGKEVSEESLAQALGLAGTGAMRDLVSAILTSKTKELSQLYKGLLDENIDLKKLCDQILDGFYRIINSIDDQQSLYKDNIVAPGSLNGITISELLWTYETLAKDLTWALSSINPEKVVLILLQKVTLRRSILSGDDVKLDEIPQGANLAGMQSAGKSEAGAPTHLAGPEKTWNEFLGYLRQTSPATASNLEYGNLLVENNVSSKPVTITVAFPEDAAFFHEYVEQKDIYAKLKNHLSDFFEVDIEQLQFRTKLLNQEEKKDKNFRTKVEVDDEIRMNKEEERRQKILNDPYVKEAEKLFNSKIDKIILKE
jgi:DNA polymerase-3 subunit gamma/tau